MRKTLLVAASAATLTLGFAAPATAAQTDDTAVTFTLTGGSLDINAPGTSALTNATTAAATTSGSIVGVAVTDLRSGVAGWVASAVSTDFTATGTTIAAASVGYASSAPVVTGFATVTPAATAAIGTIRPVQTATTVVGDNSATWTATVEVTLPADARAGAYAGTITHSVL
jgi:hypothetical protein